MRDSAVSDVVGTVILLGVTVTLVSVYAVEAYSNAAVKEGPLKLTIGATVSLNGTVVSILHLGGAALPQGSLRIVMSVNGQLWYNAIAAPPGTIWSVGNSMNVTISPLPTGVTASLEVIHTGRGETIATATVRPKASGPPPTPPDFTVTLVNATTPNVTRPGSFLIQVVASHPNGRMMIDTISANASSVDGPLWVAFRDEGTQGDVNSSDGVWSAIIAVPLSSPSGLRTLNITAVALDGVRSPVTSAMVQVV